MLLFAAFHYDNRNGQILNPRTSLVAIDRRNGRLVYEGDLRDMYRMGLVEIRGEPAENRVRIATNNEIVNLTFTPKPVKTTVRRNSAAQKPRAKLGEALLDAVQGAAGLPQ